MQFPKGYRKRAIAIFFLLFFVLGQSATFASASEVEEVDDFNVVPSYRWGEVNDDGDNVIQSLEGEYYLSNYENDSGSVSPFQRERLLDSRDMYFSSRFSLDYVNETDYFSVILGDACDFTEGDKEGFTGLFYTPPIVSVSNGMIFFQTDANREGISREHTNIDWELITGYEITYMAQSGSDFQIELKYETGYYNPPNKAGGTTFASYDSFTEDGQWHTDSFTMGRYTDYPSPFDKFDILFILNDNSAGMYIYIDSFKIFISEDFATIDDDEVKDTWDFEDGREYFAHAYGDVQDFNDGAGVYVTGSGSTTLTYKSSGWLEFAVNTGGVSSMLAVSSGLSISASTYRYFSLELIMTTNLGSWTTTNIRDGSNNIVASLGGGSYNTKYYLYGDLLADPDWTGTETGVQIYFGFSNPALHKIEVNMTYLHKVQWGDIESFGASGLKYRYVDPNGWLTTLSSTTDPFIIDDPCNIDLDQFNRLKMRIYPHEVSGSLVLYWRKGVDYYSYTLLDTTTYYGSWFNIDLNLSALSANWNGDANVIRLDFGSTAGTYFSLDYFYLISDIKEQAKFKFGIYDYSLEESAYFGFQEIDETTLEFSFDFYDVNYFSFIYYSEEFAFDSGSWLRFSVELELDRKTLKIDLRHDNGTKILSGGLFSFIDFLPRQPSALFSGTWFPHLVIDATCYYLENIYLGIDYIEANFDRVNIRQPNESYESYFFGTVTQDTVGYTVNPFGVYLEGTTSSFDTSWFMMDIDKLDGLNYDFLYTATNLDYSSPNDDRIEYNMEFYNVLENGTLYFVGEVVILLFKETATTYKTNFLAWTTEDVVIEAKTSSSTMKGDGRISFYHESQEACYLQVVWNVDGVEIVSLTMKSLAGDVPLTKEYVVYWFYACKTDVSGYSDDTMRFSIGGLDITRKDILGDIAGAILTPIVEVLGLIFAPLILLLQLVGFILLKGFELVADSFEVALAPVISVIGSLGSLIWGFFSSSLGTIVSGIAGLATGIFDAFSSVLSDIVSGISELATGIITALLEQMESLAGDLLDGLLVAVATIQDIIDVLWVWLVNDIIFGIIYDSLAVIGMEWLIDDLVEVLQAIGDFILNFLAFTITALVWITDTFVFLYDNLDGIIVICCIVWLLWVFFPLTYFLQSDFEDWFSQTAYDIFDDIIDKFLRTFEIVFNVCYTVINLIYQLLITVGGFIPFT